MSDEHGEIEPRHEPSRPQGEQGALNGVTRRRELFWQNVVREILDALSVAARSGGRLSASPKGAAMSTGPLDEMFDGRMAVITRLGQRIPIADVFPVFACSVGRTPGDRMLSADVQCTVFQIHTPGGEVYTIPVHEVVAFHSLSEELVRRLEQAAQASQENEDEQYEGMPFGFAAYTQLARAEREARERAAEENPFEV